MRLNHARLLLRSGPDYRQSFPATAGDSNDIHVTVWEGHLNATVNGKPALGHYQFWTNPSQVGTHVGVAAYHGGAGSIVRVKDLQIRRLTKRPNLFNGPQPAPGHAIDDRANAQR